VKPWHSEHTFSVSDKQKDIDKAAVSSWEGVLNYLVGLDGQLLGSPDLQEAQRMVVRAAGLVRRYNTMCGKFPSCLALMT
jgi:hypothetical protein